MKRNNELFGISGTIFVCNWIHLPSHVAWFGVKLTVSFALWTEFSPVRAGINMVEYAIDNPKLTINRFFTELAKIYGEFI